ncbi:MAG: NAD(P)/FAD-dependent oxidoreductase [Sumerlaeia bacterium]
MSTQQEPTAATGRGNDSGTQRIVVIGGGFAGAYCAQHLRKKLKGLDAEVTLIDMNNYFIFYPLLFEASTGEIEPRHTTVSIRHFVKGTEFKMARVMNADLEEQYITYRLVGVEEDFRLYYDHLVFALGSVTRMPKGIPGLKEHAFEMKTLGDAVALRDGAIRRLEMAENISDPVKREALLHTVVVGGNYTGIEVAGELNAFMRKAVKKRYPSIRPDEIKTTLIELSDKILPTMEPKLARQAMAAMKKRGIRFRLENTTTEIAEDHVILKDGDRLETRTVVWAAGIQPSPMIEKMGFPKSPRGYVLCERDCRVVGYPNVWAIGDSAQIKDAQGNAYPPTAQHATRQGKQCAANIALALRGQPTETTDIKSKGMMAAIGNHNAVADLKGAQFSGFFAWLLWRMAYLSLMPTWSRRSRVFVDWTLSAIFPHDYVQLGLHRSSSRQAQATGLREQERIAAEAPAARQA